MSCSDMGQPVIRIPVLGADAETVRTVALGSLETASPGNGRWVIGGTALLMALRTFVSVAREIFVDGWSCVRRLNATASNDF